MRCNNMFLQTTCVLNTGYPSNMWHNRPESIREWNPKRSITHTSTQLSLVASVIEMLQSLVQHLSVWMFLLFSLQIFLQLIGFICSSFVSKHVLQLPLMIFMFSRRLFLVYVFLSGVTLPALLMHFSILTASVSVESEHIQIHHKLMVTNNELIWYLFLSIPVSP